LKIYLAAIRKAFEQANPQLIKYSPYDRKTSEYGADTYHIFVDFKAAYDSVLRNKLYEAMLHLRIPGKLIRLTKMTMKTVQCSAKIQNDISEQFETNKGLRQGDALACLLFNVLLEKVTRDAGILNSGTIYKVHSKSSRNRMLVFKWCTVHHTNLCLGEKHYCYLLH
jgi:hypothetical protein